MLLLESIMNVGNIHHYIEPTVSFRSVIGHSMGKQLCWMVFFMSMVLCAERVGECGFPGCIMSEGEMLY
jgi:hypothetical protein